jgi:hypothetical protein
VNIMPCKIAATCEFCAYTVILLHTNNLQVWRNNQVRWSGEETSLPSFQEGLVTAAPCLRGLRSTHGHVVAARVAWRWRRCSRQVRRPPCRRRDHHVVGLRRRRVRCSIVTVGNKKSQNTRSVDAKVTSGTRAPAAW